jgi:NADH-quinone oxidoreductase subunit I
MESSDPGITNPDSKDTLTSSYPKPSAAASPAYSSSSLSTAAAFIRAIESGSKHLLIKRFTFRYPEQKLKFVGDGYQFDPKRGVGIAGYRGRHILYHDKCTGCQLCSIACEGIAEAIGMVKVDEKWDQNKKSIMPQIDYGKCVFCGLCVDACPFYALSMTNDYELSAFTKEHLIYTPAQLAIKPKYEGDVVLQVEDWKGSEGQDETTAEGAKKGIRRGIKGASHGHV